jgi:electron transport complex protein RnfB
MKLAVRKRLPKELAVIDVDRCTGCRACIEVCPVDCIETRSPEAAAPGFRSWCEIDLDRCIGCRLCIRIPTRTREHYTLEVCPWGAIAMVPLEQLAGAIERVGGPPEHQAEIRRRLWPAAERQRALARGG